MPPVTSSSNRWKKVGWHAIRVLAPLAIGIGALATWEFAVGAWKLSPFVLPGPRQIAVKFAEAEARSMLASAWWVTVKTAGFALLIAAVSGATMAVALTTSRVLELSLFPYAVMLQVTPLVAVAPLIVIWVGMERTQLIWLVCAWIVAFFPILSNTVVGLRSTDEKLRDLFASLKATRWDRLRLLSFPSALPYFLAGLKISANLSLVGAVVAEFITGAAVEQPGLASVIFDAQYRLDVPLMFAALTLISLTGVCFFYAAHGVGYFLLHRWHESYLD